MATFDVTKLPPIMRANGWKNGARLMERWFAGRAAVAPSYTFADTSTIQMDGWVLTFHRAKQVFDLLVKERIWANPKAREQISLALQRGGSTAPRYVFGDLSKDVQAIHRDYVNYRVVNFKWDDLDDMTAALGNFAFHVAVSGEVQRLPAGQRQIAITEVGIYIRDSYDFNGDQLLGFWNADDNKVSMVNPLAGTSVTNADFRAWRDANNAGGDFLVFSDVKRIKLDLPDVFTLP